MRVRELFSFKGIVAVVYQLDYVSGPLCAEPLMGVCFILEDLKVNVQESTGKFTQRWATFSRHLTL